MDTPTYYSNDQYTALIATLKRIAPVAPSLKIQLSAWTGTVTDDEVKTALGETCNIWPESIRADMEQAA
jgi:hypothetical protein